MERYDILIVGAGPAGISTALYLQQIAPERVSRTLVLEKARHPRPKICAGGVMPDGVRLLRGLGLDIRDIPATPVNLVQFGYNDQGVVFEEEGENTPFHFYIVLREELDAWLVARARERGIGILEESPVRKVSRSGDWIEVATEHQTYQARVVVGADGAQSVVRRAIGGGKARYARALQVWAPPPPGHPLHRERGVYFDFQYVPQGIPGYIWDFPVQIRGQAMRCWGIYDSHVLSGKAERRIREAFYERLAHYGYRPEEHRLYGGVIHHFYPDNVFSVPGVLLVGDAAGVDALFGEGISPALGYGKIAAQTIADAFAREDFSFRDYRERVMKSGLGTLLMQRLRIASILYRLRSPVLQRFIWLRCAGAVRWSIRRMMDWAARG
ncbi:MAG: NAD(P)/FAD-dependent oxidoreductase [Anaerolineae bacterium]|nr:NAD(P)/FAD-dependent oxidoreductase [Anaerolineae bacterium]MDW8068618.1 NAD(P)/FAD-dependent oxidoreductase [Anaerolineae bacterium]